RSFPRVQIELTQCPKDFYKLRGFTLVVAQGCHPRILLRAQDGWIVLTKNQPQAIAIHPFGVRQMADDLVWRPLPCKWPGTQYCRRIFGHNVSQGRRRLRHYIQRISFPQQTEHLLSIGLTSGHKRCCLSSGHCGLLPCTSSMARKPYCGKRPPRYPNLALKAS